MGLFSNLKDDNLEESKDVLGGGFQPLKTDVYTGIIKAAYAGESDAGAMNVTFIVDVGDRQYNETIYVTNRQKQNFYVKNDKEFPLPGYTLVGDICMLTTEKPLSVQDTEDKVIELYNFDAGKKVPTTVPMLVDLLGQKIALGIQEIEENKRAKNEDTGKWEPTGETKVINKIDKPFHHELLVTLIEARAGEKGHKFHDAWIEKHQGKLIDKTTKVDNKGSTARSTKSSGSDGGGKKTSLFG